MTTEEPTTFATLHKPLWDRLVDLALAQIANRSIRPSEKEAKSRHEKFAIDMRESLEYRFSAVGLHAGVLRQFQQRGLEQLASAFVSGDDGHDTTYAARRQQQMLFDSIIFNILALFDYVGNAIGFSFYGVDSGAGKWKWKRAVQYAKKPELEEKDFGSRRYSNSEIAAMILQFNSEWINRLEEYRAELIHYKTEPAGGGHSFHFSRNEPAKVGLNITTPPSFTKWVKYPGKTRGEPVPLLEAADWLILKTQSQVLSVVTALITMLESDPAPPDGGLRVKRIK